MDALALSLNSLVAPQTFIRVNAESRVDELAKSVGREGLLEPLVVMPSMKELGKYEVVCGLRRYLAAKKAGLETVPCIVKEMSDIEALEAMLIKNMERENLSDYELGRWFKLLMERCPDKYPNQEAIAERFNLSRQLVGFLIAHCEVVDQLISDMPPNIATRVAMLPERVPDKYPKQKAIADRFKLSESYVWQLIEHYEFLEKINLPRGKLLSEGGAREIRRAVPPNMVARATMSEVTLVTLVTDPLYGLVEKQEKQRENEPYKGSVTSVTCVTFSSKLLE